MSKPLIDQQKLQSQKHKTIKRPSTRNKMPVRKEMHLNTCKAKFFCWYNLTSMQMFKAVNFRKKVKTWLKLIILQIFSSGFFAVTYFLYLRTFFCTCNILIVDFELAYTYWQQSYLFIYLFIHSFIYFIYSYLYLRLVSNSSYIDEIQLQK